MSLENSPSFNQHQPGLPPRPPKPVVSRARMYGLLVIIGILLVTIVGINVVRSDRAAFLLGTGTVNGVALDETGKPMANAQIFIERTDLQTQTDAQGAFQVRGVPSGSRLLVVAQNGAGNEFFIVVAAGASTDVGALKFVNTTRVPGQ